VIRLDHIQISVRDWRAARDWYVAHFGFEVEFENPNARTAALGDDSDLTLFVSEDAPPL
jgi:catechol 2,3-dioxygenase-like lactoylglutathione lyase family enzyme